MSALAKRLKIAVLSRSFSTQGGGAERYSVQVAALIAQSHDVHVFAQNFGDLPQGITAHRVGPELRRPRWLNQLVFAWQTWRLTRSGFDVVHSHENTWYGNVQTLHVKSVRGSVLGPRRGWRLVLARLKVASSPRKLTYLALEAARCRAAPGKVQVAVSKLLAADFAANYPSSSFEVITPGVDLPAQLLERAEAQAQLGLDPRKQWLLLVGNDFKRKGLPCALQALAQLPDQVCLAVAGNTQQQAQFEAFALRLGVAERLRFLGSLSDVSVAYQAADLLVHPTLEDSYAMAVVEAMANDLPVIVSGPAFCGVAAELSHQVNAWLLQDPLDAAELAKAISSLLSNKELQRQVLIGSQAFFALKTWQNTALMHERLYQRIAAYKVAYKAGAVASGDSAASPNKALDTPPEAK